MAAVPRWTCAAVGCELEAIAGSDFCDQHKKDCCEECFERIPEEDLDDQLEEGKCNHCVEKWDCWKCGKRLTWNEMNYWDTREEDPLCAECWGWKCDCTYCDSHNTICSCGQTPSCDACCSWCHDGECQDRERGLYYESEEESESEDESEEESESESE